MKYSRVQGTITVEFSFAEYEMLMAILGAALIMSEGQSLEKDIGAFIMDLNKTNPDLDLFVTRINNNEDFKH